MARKCTKISNQTLEEKKIQLAADCSKEEFRVMQQSAGYQQLQINAYISTGKKTRNTINPQSEDKNAI